MEEFGYRKVSYDRKTPKGVFLLLFIFFAAAIGLAVFLSVFAPEKDAFEEAWLRMLLGEENETADVRVETALDPEAWSALKAARTEGDPLAVLTLSGRRAAFDRSSGSLWLYLPAEGPEPASDGWRCGGEPGLRAAFLSETETLAVWTDTSFAEYAVRVTALPTVTLRRAENALPEEYPESELIVQAEQAWHLGAKQMPSDGGVLFSLWKAGKKHGIHLTAQTLCGLPASGQWRITEDGEEDGLRRRVLFFDETGYRGVRLLECAEPVSE